LYKYAFLLDYDDTIFPTSEIRNSDDPETFLFTTDQKEAISAKLEALLSLIQTATDEAYILTAGSPGWVDHSMDMIYSEEVQRRLRSIPARFNHVFNDRGNKREAFESLLQETWPNEEGHWWNILSYLTGCSAKILSIWKKLSPCMSEEEETLTKVYWSLSDNSEDTQNFLDICEQNLGIICFAVQFIPQPRIELVVEEIQLITELLPSLMGIELDERLYLVEFILVDGKLEYRFFIKEIHQKSKYHSDDHRSIAIIL
jgi:hypothetical protein